MSRYTYTLKEMHIRCKFKKISTWNQRPYVKKSKNIQLTIDFERPPYLYGQTKPERTK